MAKKFAGYLTYYHRAYFNDDWQFVPGSFGYVWEPVFTHTGPGLDPGDPQAVSTGQQRCICVILPNSAIPVILPIEIVPPGGVKVGCDPSINNGTTWAWDGNTTKPTLDGSIDTTEHYDNPALGWHGWIENGMFYE